MVATAEQNGRPTDTIGHQTHVELYRGRKALANIRPAWQKLSVEGANQFTYFQSAAWCESWLETHHEADPLIVTVWQDGALQMVVPLAQKSSFGVSILDTLSGADAEYSVPLANPGADTISLFEHALEALGASGEFDLLRFNSVPEELGLQAIAQPEHRLECDLEYSSIIELGGLETLDDYLATRSKSTRRSLRRKMKEFDKLGKVERSVTPVTETYMREIFPAICDWKRQWFLVNGVLGGNFNKADMQEQLMGFCRTGSGRDPVLATELRLNGNLVACDLILQQKDVLYSYVTARDLAFDKYGVGTVMDMHTIEHAIRSGFRAFDLLSGPNPSKDSLSNRQVPLVDLRFPFTEIGGWQLNIDRLKLRNHLKTTFYKMPIGVRQSIIALRN